MTEQDKLTIFLLNSLILYKVSDSWQATIWFVVFVIIAAMLLFKEVKGE